MSDPAEQPAKKLVFRVELLSDSVDARIYEFLEQAIEAAQDDLDGYLSSISEDVYKAEEVTATIRIKPMMVTQQYLDELEEE